MIIDDNSDAVSTNTLVPNEKIPRYFLHLTYASLGFSILPFIFSLINVAISPLQSIPTILAYVFTTPFHIAALLVIWQHKRQIDTMLPFEPSAPRTMAYIFFLAALWIFSTVTCGFGSERFVRMQPCFPVPQQPSPSPTVFVPYPEPNSTLTTPLASYSSNATVPLISSPRTLTSVTAPAATTLLAPLPTATLFMQSCRPYKRVMATFVVSTVLAGFEVIIIVGIILVCYLNRPRKAPMMPSDSYPLAGPNPKTVPT